MLFEVIKEAANRLARAELLCVTPMHNGVRPVLKVHIQTIHYSKSLVSGWLAEVGTPKVCHYNMHICNQG